MSFKVIDGGGPSKEERDKVQAHEEQVRRREWAKGDISWAVRECAANLLRIVRGAGKPHELLLQMKKVIDSAVKFQEVHGYWPDDVIAAELHLDDERQEILERCRAGNLSQADIDRWRNDGTLDEMSAEYITFCGALQVIASRMIGQKTQESAGDSEFHRGLRELEEVREGRRRRALQEMRASRAAPARRKTIKKRKLKPRTPPGGIVL
ncbi:hypothetical protein [Bradyrhizobium guangxiense]|uniref:hypothetical protein n=1 Tax=Bradyrhizobium guangxiense TaxID=1325115 RepID=UPI001008FA5D|nr:hypothetical protein [Bradyrhizobium guangxiense]